MSNELKGKLKSVLTEAVDDAFDAHARTSRAQTIADFVRQGDVIDLARAIRDGDRAGADMALDLVARGSAIMAEWIAQGRAS